MKWFVVFALTLASSAAFADQRVFDCQATGLSKTLETPTDVNLRSNPTVIFRDGLNWSLQVGDLLMSYVDSEGPALSKKTTLLSKTVQFDFWVDGSYEYELQVSVVNHSAKLFWWGTGKRVHLGNFACEVIEQ